jgi:hypothetical protein
MLKNTILIWLLAFYQVVVIRPNSQCTNGSDSRFILQFLLSCNMRGKKIWHQIVNNDVTAGYCQSDDWTFLKETSRDRPPASDTRSDFLNLAFCVHRNYLLLLQRTNGDYDTIILTTQDLCRFLSEKTQDHLGA